jgi:hypothetical protein
MEELDDIQRIDTQPLAPLLGPSALQPVHELNQRLITILIEESCKPSGTIPCVARLGEMLAPLSDEVRNRLVAIPISLMDAGFKLETRWTSLAAGDRREERQSSELALPRSRALETAPLVYGLAVSTARTSQESAQLIFGMSSTSAAAFARFGVPIVQWLGQTRAHWVCPRWHQRPEVWQRLILTASRAELARLPSVAVRAVNLLLADLELARS